MYILPIRSFVISTLVFASSFGPGLLAILYMSLIEVFAEGGFCPWKTPVERIRYHSLRMRIYITSMCVISIR
jgi:hypothetical protein